MRTAILTALLAAMAPPAPALELSLEYRTVPATYQYVERDYATGVGLSPVQRSKELSLGTAGLRVNQALPPFVPAMPLRLGFETGFSVPAGSQAFDQGARVANPGGLSATTFKGDSVEWSAVTIPVMVTVAYEPPVETIAVGGWAGLGLTLVSLEQVTTETVLRPPLYDTDAVVTRRERITGGTLTAELGLNLIVPVTRAVSFKVGGAGVWMSMLDAAAGRDDAEGDFVDGIQVGGLGFAVRAALTSVL